MFSFIFVSVQQFKLINPTQSRFEHLVTQMKWRLQEGDGEAIYEIGVEDSGMLTGLTSSELNASLNTLTQMAKRSVIFVMCTYISSALVLCCPKPPVSEKRFLWLVCMSCLAHVSVDLFFIMFSNHVDSE